MYDLQKCIIVTNNDRVVDKWDGMVEEMHMVETYEQVLYKVRDLIHTGHKLLTHPQASSLKPNQTPYRTMIVYGGKETISMEDISLIENAIETFQKWNEIKRTPEYSETISEDYKTIDLSMIENVIPRL